METVSLWHQMAEDMRFSARAAKAQRDAAYASDKARGHREQLIDGGHDALWLMLLIEADEYAAEHYAKARAYMDRVAAEGDLIEWDDGEVSATV